MKQEVVIGEMYRAKQSEDLHFHMVKVNAVNEARWRAFADRQTTFVKHSPQNNTDKFKETHKKYLPIIKNIGVGANGFDEGIEFYNNVDTEVWVAYASYTNIEDPNTVDYDKIEMCALLITSRNAPFITLTNILRSIEALFVHPVHKDLANQLHTFAAQVMLKRYPTKRYMIYTPEFPMREILISAFAEKKATDAVYVLDHKSYHIKETQSIVKNYLDDIDQLTDGKLSQIEEDVYGFIFQEGLYEDLREDLEKEKIKLKPNLDLAKKSPETRLDIIREYSNLCVTLHLLNQHYAVHSGAAFTVTPITLQPRAAVRWKYDFILQDGTHEPCRLSPDLDKTGEYKWFFEHPYLLQYHSMTNPMILVNLEQLAHLRDIKPSLDHKLIMDSESDWDEMVKQEKNRQEKKLEDDRKKKRDAHNSEMAKLKKETEEGEREAELFIKKQDYNNKIRELDKDIAAKEQKAKQYKEQQRKEAENKEQEAQAFSRLIYGAAIGGLTGLCVAYLLRANTSWPQTFTSASELVGAFALAGALLGYSKSPPIQETSQASEANTCNKNPDSRQLP